MPGKRLTLIVGSAAIAACGLAVFGYRDELLERFYLYKLDSAIGDDRWQFAAELEAIGSPRVEDWYTERLEDDNWASRARAAERLSERRVVRAIPAIVTLKHPASSKAGRRGGDWDPVVVYSINDLVPRSLKGAERFDHALARFLGRGVVVLRQKPGTLLVKTPAEVHEDIRRDLDARRIVRRLLQRYGAAALEELDHLSGDPGTMADVRELAALEAAVLRVSGTN